MIPETIYTFQDYEDVARLLVATWGTEAVQRVAEMSSDRLQVVRLLQHVRVLPLSPEAWKNALADRGLNEQGEPTKVLCRPGEKHIARELLR